MSRRLQNYLRMYRRRSRLSQYEVAVLLGTRSGTKVSRYEHSARQPNLQTALAYEAIFHVPVRELFAGIYQKVDQTVTRRARLLAERLGKAKPNRTMLHKLEMLRTLLEPANEEPLQQK